MSLSGFTMAESAIAEQLGPATRRTPPNARVIVPKPDWQMTPQSR